MTRHLRSRHARPILTACLILSAVAVARTASAATSEGADRLAAIMAREPLAFEPAAAPAGAFVARAAGGAIHVSPSAMDVAIAGGDVVTLRLLGADPNARAVAEDRLPGRINYLVDADRSRWRANVPRFASVSYEQALPGIDVIHHGRRGRLEHDFRLSPGADVGAIRLAVEGGRDVALAADGALVIETARGNELRLMPPVAYEERPGDCRDLASRFTVAEDGTFGFVVDGWRGDAPLVIDPELEFSTYLTGVSWWERFHAVAVAPDGGLLVAGTLQTYAPGVDPAYPTTPGAFGAGQPEPQITGYLGIVTKLTPDGQELEYSTYLPWGTFVRGIAVDALGRAWIVGAAHYFREDQQLPFPVTPGAFQPTHRCDDPCRCGDDGFVATISADGSSLSLFSYLGGGRHDDATSVAIAPDGSAWVVGTTESRDFPTINALSDELDNGSADPDGPNFFGGQDAFVSRIAADGSALLVSTYLGAERRDGALDVAVGPDGAAYVTGFLASKRFRRLPQACDIARFSRAEPPYGDMAFVAKIAPEGGTRGGYTWSSGAWGIVGMSIAVDPAGSAYVGGWVLGDGIHAEDGWQPRRAGASDGFVLKMTSTGTPAWATYVGGSGDDMVSHVDVDSWGTVHVTGVTASADFPVARPVFDRLSGYNDAFVSRFSPDGRQLVFSSFLGGAAGSDGLLDRYGDSAYAIAATADGGSLLAGWTDAGDFPLASALQSTAPCGLAGAPPSDDGMSTCPPHGFVSLFSRSSYNQEPSALDLAPWVPPLTVTRDRSGRTVVGWEETMGGHYALLIGTLHSLWRDRRYDHRAIVPCDLTVNHATFDPPSEDTYVLVIGTSYDEPRQSSYGRDSFGRERPRSADPCP